VSFAGLLTLTACANAPERPAPVLGETMAEVGAAQDTTLRRPAFAFQSNTHRIALYAVDTWGALVTDGATGSAMLVFEDDHYIGKLDADMALDFSSCLAQPDGLTLLAERLHSLCAGNADPLAQPGPVGKTTTGELRCPPGEDGTPPIVNATEGLNEPTLLDGLGQVVFLSIGLVLSPVLVPAGLVYAGGAKLYEQPSLDAQEKLQLGMTSVAATELMGKPTATFFLDPAHTQVRYFERLISHPLWVGFEDDQLVWIRFGYTDKWLNAATARLREAAKAPESTKNGDLQPQDSRQIGKPAESVQQPVFPFTQE
jgi:hypothetical protein